MDKLKEQLKLADIKSAGHAAEWARVNGYKGKVSHVMMVWRELQQELANETKMSYVSGDDMTVEK